MQTRVVPADTPAGTPVGRRTATTITPPAEQLAQARELLQGAKAPVIIVGHGARFAMAQVTALADTLHAPVLTTFKAKGLIADDHELGCVVLGRSGTPIASYFMNEADVLIVFGASFSILPALRLKFPPSRWIATRCIWVSSTVACPVWGEIGVTAGLLNDDLSCAHGDWDDRRPQIAERWAIWRAEKASRRTDDQGKGINAAIIFDRLADVIDDDAVIAVDVGNNTYSFGRYFECKQQAVLMSGYLGSIGFGFPAAMGAGLR